MSDTKQTIVIVEDNDGMRRALERLLTLAGYNALAYESAEALDAASGIERAGCLVLDVQLPGASGPTLYAQLREPRPPAIFVTSHDNETTRLAVANAGGVHFLVKPFAGTDLLKLIATLGTR
ncbi:two component sigma54 specific Fis family transcriptional regulator [Caballeronia temeraria]|uniref:Two component sigma54 specific Fis family transcriptional regulator n=1 Tax=Caballeronia temeraria TaxID=1777137 RepID=A0A158BZA5_9BURK|nr:response regulator [Caballeronia temeraria]SAK75422.1 two component sigma54 specific Fis family transcriptional regulator [Caballeronia temeraria]